MTRDEASTVALLTDLVRARTPFLHVRFGDGDVFFATGTGPRLTGDGETWTPELCERLHTAWRRLATFPGRLLVGDIESYAVSDGCEPQWHELVAEAEELRGQPLELVHMEALRVSFGNAAPFYQALAEDPRGKVYVAPARLAPAAAMLDATLVEVPLHVAHERADTTTREVLDLVAEGAEVVLFSAGRGGKIVQGNLALDPRAASLTQIDVGSGLDVLFTDLRRGTDGRVNVDQLRDDYRRQGLTL